MKILPMVSTLWNKFRSLTEKKKFLFIFCFKSSSTVLFRFIPRGVPLPQSNALQYYVKREKCKVNDVIFPSGCEARAINLGNKNIKIGIFNRATCVRSKNIFTTISLPESMK